MSKIDALQAHDWLSLVNLSGLLVSEPILHEFFLNGPSPVESYSYRRLKREWERYQLKKEKNGTQAQYNWLNFVFEEFLDIPRGTWQRSTEISDKFTVNLFEYNQTLRPSRVILDGIEEALLLVYVAPTDQRLDKPETETGRWRASPLTKFDRLLRDSKVPLGLLTNGEEFCLMYATAGLTTASITWNAQSWIEEKQTADAFFTLLNHDRFFGDAKKRLLSLVEESQKKQIDVTDQLGEQVRSALELFIRAIDEADKASDGELLKDVSEDELYEISLTVMMRLVFLLYAEENLLLPHGEMLYDNAYGITHLWFELQKDRELLKQTHDAWDRLLATFRLIYDGCPHPDLILKAYGGTLFDPKRFPILEDERLRISNETIYQIIRKLTFAKAKIGRTSINQRVSYRTLDIEQIGSVYESLMEYKTKRASELLVVFRGKDQAIRPLSEFEHLKNEELVTYIKTVTGMNEKKIRSYLEGILQNEEVDLIDLGEHEILTETELNRRLDHFKPFIYTDQVIDPGDLYITREGSIRKGSGSYYTPKQLTSFLVEQALEPLCYIGEGRDKRIKNPKEILSIKVCDPAMGSGAFLVQACRYLAERLIESWDLAQAEQPDSILTIPYAEPSRGDIDEQIMEEDREKQLVWAKRFVVENCLYGVDLNPLAVELAKMSLWLATLSKDRPFNFMDHRLRCGNSLIGAEFSRLASIPSEPLWKEDKKHNNAILKNHLSTISEISTPELVRNIIPQRNELAAHECRILDVKHKEELLSKLEEEGSSYSSLKKVCDLWCSVWFWPYNEKNDGERMAAPPHTNIYRQLLKYIATGDTGTLGEDECKEYLRIAQQVDEEQRFFHWELEFPEIFREAEGGEKENPGFEAVIGNPPWDVVKPNSQEFFSSYDPNFRNYPKQKAKTVMKILLENLEISGLWNKYTKNTELQSAYYRKSKIYSNLGSGDINLYKLFLERFFQRLREGGYESIIIPSGIYTDKGCTPLRKLFLLTSSIKNLISFENRKKIFPIDIRFKYVLFTTQKGGFTVRFRAGFRLHDLDILGNLEQNTIWMDRRLIERFSPDSLSPMEFNNQKDIDITSKIYDNWPLLGEDLKGIWNVKFTREFDMTNDSHLFLTSEQLEKIGAIPDSGGKRWTDLMGKKYLPLCFGEHFWMGNFSADSLKLWIEENSGRNKYSGSCSKNQLYDYMRYRTGIRRIAANTNERTLVAGVIPKMFFSTYGMENITAFSRGKPLINQPTNKEMLLLFSCLVSFCEDYIMRKKGGMTSVPINYLYQLPIPRLENSNWFFDQLVSRSARLICVTKEFTDLWHEVYELDWQGLFIGDDGTSLIENWRELTPHWSENCGIYGWTADKRDTGDRAQLRAEIDALVAHLYGLTAEEFSYILDTFPVLKKNEEAAFGEFRSKRMCLEEYRRLAPIIEEEKKKNPAAFEIPKYEKVSEDLTSENNETVEMED